jgi:hypothetical protein
MSATTERVLGVLLGLYIAGSTVVTTLLPWLNELLHPKTESDQIAALGVKVGLFTMLLVGIQIALVGFQIWIALRQTKLQETELHIVKTQNDILNRTEDLELTDVTVMNPWPGHPYDDDFQLELVNKGKSVDGARVHIFLEQYDAIRAFVLPQLTLPARFDEEWTQGYSDYVFVPGGNSYNLTEYTKWFDVLLPGDGRKTMFPAVVLHVEKEGQYRVHWAVETRNGWFPKDRRFATIELMTFGPPPTAPVE